MNMCGRRYGFIFALILGSAGHYFPALAQNEGTLVALQRDTPRASATGFLSAADQGDFQRAAQFLDLRNLPDQADRLGGSELARQLGIILQRGGWIDLHALSDEAGGADNDGLPGYRDVLGRIQQDDGQVVLLLQRVPGTNGTQIWKISNATVASIPKLYEQFGYSRLVEAVARTLPNVSILGVELFKWAIVLMAGLLSLLLLIPAGWYGAVLFAISESQNLDRVRWFLTRPVALLAVFLVMRWTAEYLGLGTSGRRLVEGWTAIVAATVWINLAAVDLLRNFYTVWLRKRGRQSAIVLLKPIGTAIKTLIMVLGLLVWLDNIGVSIAALITGLGVGGIAVALALQKPFEDVVAAVTLFTQQPIRVGDFCRFGDQVGTVEEIGLRNTRIRTRDNSLLSLPNAKFAQEYIENISAREKIRYCPTIRLQYDTSKECVETVLSGIRDLLKSHEMVDPEPARVRFTDFEHDALKLEIFAYVRTTDFNEFLKVGEELNLKIIEIVSAAGVKLAFSFPLHDVDSATMNGDFHTGGKT